MALGVCFLSGSDLISVRILSAHWSGIFAVKIHRVLLLFHKTAVTFCSHPFSKLNILNSCNLSPQKSFLTSHQNIIQLNRIPKNREEHLSKSISDLLFWKKKMPLLWNTCHYTMLCTSLVEVVRHSTSAQIFIKNLPRTVLGKFLKTETVNYFIYISFILHIDRMKTNQILTLQSI